MFFDEFSAWAYFFAHKNGEHSICFYSIFNSDLFEQAVTGVDGDSLFGPVRTLVQHDPVSGVKGLDGAGATLSADLEIAGHTRTLCEDGKHRR